ncbi:DEAD/DEAH box helicase [Lacticaseibacillus songhuajiangensis]|jgi:SNF2 family DNA or RNA helicase|uniref:DEAD/DEAH box helicase n=1 Tax=Lacticaseibacillus songhuajiangensis TaxID=1296539 RepID=UPI000F77C766|nr:DEAD/DEAH box helicase [Lacticaseibacillus songhuajiangensis]
MSFSTIREVNDVLKKADTVHEKSVSVMHTADDLERQLIISADTLLGAERDSLLKKQKIESLEGVSENIISSEFQSWGIKNLLDLEGRLSSNSSLPGIANEEYIRIRKRVHKIYESMIQSVKLRIDFDTYPTKSARLVHYLRVNGQVEQISRTVKEAEKDSYADELRIKQGIDPRKHSRFWLIFTSSGQKSLREQKVDDLKRWIISESERTNAIISQLDEIATFRVVDEKEYFSVNAATLYAQMEHADLPGTKTQPFDKKLIPKTLADNVNATPINIAGFKSVLRGWQKFGAKYILSQHKALLGDEMGLGKTVQALAAITDRANAGYTHFLVVCPSSIIINWEREVAKHTSMHTINLRGNKETRDAKLVEWAQTGGIGICNYESVWRLDKEILFSHTQFLVADEAHLVKNPGRKRSDFVTSLAEKTPYALFMTGTALENHVEDMINLIVPLYPKILKILGLEGLSKESRADNFSRYLRSKRLDHADSLVFRKAIAPVYLRRNRNEVLNELPPLTQVEEWSDFSDSQMTLYKTAVEEQGFMAMRRVAWEGPQANEIPKLVRLKELCSDASKNGEKVLIFSFFKNVLSTIYQSMPDIAIPPITGAISTIDRQARIDEFVDSTEKFVLPAQIDTLGYGLNLQTASIVVLAEPQFKPSTEAQAISRAYRMGQTKNVRVIRLLTENSVDELMMNLLQSKSKLFDAFARDSAMADSSALAKDKSEQNLVNTIIASEQRRLAI